jgi:hypothetical protein
MMCGAERGGEAHGGDAGESVRKCTMKGLERALLAVGRVFRVGRHREWT